MGNDQGRTMEEVLDRCRVRREQILMPQIPIGIAVDGRRTGVAIPSGIEGEMEIIEDHLTRRQARRIKVDRGKRHHPIGRSKTRRLDIDEHDLGRQG